MMMMVKVVRIFARKQTFQRTSQSRPKEQAQGHSGTDKIKLTEDNTRKEEVGKQKSKNIDIVNQIECTGNL